MKHILISKIYKHRYLTLSYRFCIAGTLLLLVSLSSAYAQADVTGALNNVTNQMKGYIQPILTMVYIIAAIMFIVGAVKVAFKFYSGDGQVGTSVFMLFGGAIFMGLLPTLISAFFGV